MYIAILSVTKSIASIKKYIVIYRFYSLSNFIVYAQASLYVMINHFDLYIFF
jgi:hypothetical protein